MNGLKFGKGAVVFILLTMLTLALPQTPPFNPVGTWDAKILLNEAGIAKKDPETQAVLREQVGRMAKHTWQMIFNEDHTYTIPPEKPDGPIVEEGTWKTGRNSLTLTTVKRKGEELKKKTNQTFKVAPDNDHFTLATGDFATVEYTRKKPDKTPPPTVAPF